MWLHRRGGTASSFQPKHNRTSKMFKIMQNKLFFIHIKAVVKIVLVGVSSKSCRNNNNNNNVIAGETVSKHNRVVKMLKDPKEKCLKVVDVWRRWIQGRSSCVAWIRLDQNSCDGDKTAGWSLQLQLPDAHQLQLINTKHSFKLNNFKPLHIFVITYNSPLSQRVNQLTSHKILHKSTTQKTNNIHAPTQTKTSVKSI